MAESDEDAAELWLIKEERLSTERSLQIYAQLSEHINLIQLTPKRNSNIPGPFDAVSLPERVINEGLLECKNNVNAMSAKLEKHILDVTDRLLMKSRIAMTSKEDIEDLMRLRDK